MDHEKMITERRQRIMRAVALQEQDRAPVVLEYAGFAARVTGTGMPEFLLDLRRSVEVMIEAYHLVAESGAADAVNYGRFSPYNLCPAWLSKVRVPGVDLPEDATYQVEEEELMSPDDYQAILSQGWPDFLKQFLEERIFNEVPAAYLPANQPPLDITGLWSRIGVPVLKEGTVAPPLEFLSGGRSMERLARDLYQRPDMVEAVLEEIVPHLCGPACAKSRQSGCPAVWVGGWRTAPSMLSPPMWERFVWPYFRRLVYEIVDQGLIPLLHLDADWTRELERFKELPPGKVIMALDGGTDIYKAKEVLGGHICIMGDVPAAMFVLETPDRVYEYCRRLLRDLGPVGFILQSGCDIPENAKLENVQAMVAAALD